MMRLGLLKSVAFVLVGSIAIVTAWPPDVQAMLVPARMAQAQPSADRSADMKTIQTTLEFKVLRDKLHKMGLSDAEIQARLSRLSDGQVHQLASQIRAVRPAGEGVIIGVLLAVLLVILIIYLIKRI